MALSLKDPETDRLAREMASFTGETLTDAIRIALIERLARERARRRHGRAGLAEHLLKIGRECAALPDVDTRTPEQIVGYDDAGVWT